MGLKRPWKIIFCWSTVEILNYPSQLSDLPFLEHDEYFRTSPSELHLPNLNTSLSKSKNTIRKFLLILGLNLFWREQGKSFVFLSFFFYIWKMYFLSFLFFRLKNLYFFKIFSEVIFPSFLVTHLFSSGSCPVGQNRSPVVVFQTRKKSFPVLRGIEEPLWMLCE